MAPATHRHAMSFPLFSVSTKMKFLSGFVLLRSFLLRFSGTLQRPLHLAFSWLGLWLTVERAIRFATNKIWHPCWAAYTYRLFLRFWIHTTYTTGIARYAPQIPPCVLYVQVGSGADRFLAERAEHTARVRVQNTRGKFLSEPEARQSPVNLSSNEILLKLQRTPHDARLWATQDFVPAFLQSAVPFWQNVILPEDRTEHLAGVGRRC